MEFLPNELEFEHLKKNKLTEYSEEKERYVLPPQRGCFLRCRECFNLSQAESLEIRGVWAFTTECEFCVRRLIDLLGWYEHKKVPTLALSGKKKEQKHDFGGIYQAIVDSVRPTNEELEASERVGDEPLTEE